MRLSLRYRYALTIGVAAVGLASLIQFFSYIESARLADEVQRSTTETMSRALRHQAETDARHLAAVLADGLIEPLIHEDFEDIYNILQAARSLPQVAEIQVYDSRAKLVHDATKDIRSYGTEAPEAVREEVLGQGRWLATFHESILEICSPIAIRDRIVGAVRFTTSLDAIRADMARLDEDLAAIHGNSADDRLHNFAWLIAGLLILGIAAGFAGADSLIQPVRDLIDMTRQIGARNFKVDMPWKRSDELGKLAAALHGMAGEIRESMISKSELERTVRERTEELRAANVLLRRHDRRRRRFLAEVSHELRTPLTVVHGEAQVTLRSGSGELSAYRDSLKKVIAQTTLMRCMVDDLLKLARADDHLTSYQFEHVPLAEILKATVENAQILAACKNIVVEGSECSDGLLIRADRQKLAQLLMNVVDNAVNYSPPGGMISVAGHGMAGVAEIVVSDQGIGLDAANQDRVFDPFFRGVAARQLRPEGSGLGLPIAKAIAEAHRGSITIVGSPGQGTSVRLRLPLDAAA